MTMPAHDHMTDAKKSEACNTACSSIKGLMWWITLIIAVVAVPLVGTSVALAITESSFMQMLMFVMTCWACTWLGMWLMKKADTAQVKKD